MSKSNFRDMNVWQRAREVAREIYRATQDFPRVETYGLTQQMRRAAVSVLCNIAEAQGRWSRAEARNFCLIARGSLLEIEAQLVIASDLDYIELERAEELIEKALEVARMVNGLIRHYEQSAD
jgi:four helix bundle protein